MKVVPIPPISLMPEALNKDILMTLAHVALDDTLGPKYRQMYREQADRGARVILDNGAYELGEPLSVDNMLWLAKEMGVTELVAPDYPMDGRRTVDAVEEALQQYGDVFEIRAGGIQMHYIPQGSTIYEWGKCLNKVMNLHRGCFEDRPCVIGIAKHYSKFAGGRLNLMRRFVDEWVRQTSFKIDVHLMGLEDDFTNAQQISTQFPWVRSVDTVKPFVWAAYHVTIPVDGTIIPEYPGRPERYFDLDLRDEPERKLSKKNMFALEFRLGDPDAHKQ